LQEAYAILNKLYDKQKEFQAFIYSPSVELELGKLAKKEKAYEKAINYFNEGIQNTRKIKNNELAEVYYETMKTYELMNNKAMSNEALGKCKALDKATTTSLYKKMCDEL
jgi:uncharacterized protein HemY